MAVRNARDLAARVIDHRQALRDRTLMLQRAVEAYQEQLAAFEKEAVEQVIDFAHHKTGERPNQTSAPQEHAKRLLPQIGRWRYDALAVAGGAARLIRQLEEGDFDQAMEKLTQ